MAKTNAASTRGFSLVEILVTLVIIMIGLLGLLGVQVRAHQAELESYQRAQALVLLNDMVERLNANRKAPQCYAITDQANIVSANGAPYLGAGSGTLPTCAAWGTNELRARADADVAAWDGLLKGSAESVGGTDVGAMIGARGCVTRDPATETFLISVAWQGLLPTADPEEADAAHTCGRGLYGADELRRRVVSTRVRIANLK